MILESIEKHISLTEDQKNLFLSMLQSKKLKRKQFFLQEGEIAKTTAYVVKGCMRSYFTDNNGFEHILQFAVEGWWIGDIGSAVYQRESHLNIDALEECEVLLLSRKDQLELMNQCPSFEKYFRIITENALAAYQQRILDNLSLPAIDRYKNFAKRYPFFVQRLPQTQIAAYLGITPEFLSKIKHQMMYDKP